MLPAENYIQRIGGWVKCFAHIPGAAVQGGSVSRVLRNLKSRRASGEFSFLAFTIAANFSKDGTE